MYIKQKPQQNRTFGGSKWKNIESRWEKEEEEVTPISWKLN